MCGIWYHIVQHFAHPHKCSPVRQSLQYTVDCCRPLSHVTHPYPRQQLPVVWERLQDCTTTVHGLMHSTEFSLVMFYLLAWCCGSVCVCVCAHKHMCVHACVCMCVHACVCMCVHACVCVHMHVYVCVCVCACVCQQCLFCLLLFGILVHICISCLAS